MLPGISWDTQPFLLLLPAQLGVSRKEKVTLVLVSPLRAPEVPARWDVRVGAKKGNAGLGGHSERVIFSMGGTRGRMSRRQTQL